MKIKLVSFLIVLSIALSVSFTPAQAQGPETQPHIFDSTQPLSEGLRADLEAWLVDHNPSTALYYVVTHQHTASSGVTFISLAGFDSDDGWSVIEDEDGNSNMIWFGSIQHFMDGSFALYDPFPQASAPSPFKLTMPSFNGPGGGAYINFPWLHGRSMMYGPRGVHGVGYSQSNMVAVDLVGGTDMGSGIAPAQAYAAAGGTITWVCSDADSTAIGVNNSDGDIFVYAHLVDNANLVEGHSFIQGGQLIGALTYGSFGEPNQGCGWADQKDNHYHLHWGFRPASGTYRAENCILNVSSGVWKCGDKSIAPKGYLVANGGCSTTAHYEGTGECEGYGAGAPLGDPTFFDYLVAGLLNIFNGVIVANLPPHDALPIIQPFLNTVQIIFRVFFILIHGNLNFIPFITLMFAALALRAIFSAIWLVGAILRTIKAIPTL